MCKICGCIGGFLNSGFCPTIPPFGDYRNCRICNYAEFTPENLKNPSCKMMLAYRKNLASIMYSRVIS